MRPAGSLRRGWRRLQGAPRVLLLRQVPVVLKRSLNTLRAGSRKQNEGACWGAVLPTRIARARRNLAEARKLITKGCELCPGSEDVWLESARLQTPDNAKAILARGVAAIPSSVKLWMQVRLPAWLAPCARDAVPVPLACLLAVKAVCRQRPDARGGAGCASWV